MKKILFTIFIYIITFSSTFGYNPNSNDEKLLNSVYTKLDLIIEKSPSRIEKLYKQINQVKKEVKSKERIYYILTQLENYSYTILTNIEDLEYTVKEVVDGDTIKISYLGKESNIRLIGIDSPESYTTRFGYKECYGDEAKEYLKNLIEGKKVKIEFDESQGKTDKYNRLLGYVIYNGENINNKVIEEGYAREYTYDKAYKYQEQFKTSEDHAKDNNKGLWNSDICNGERINIDEINNGEELEDLEKGNSTTIESYSNNSDSRIYNTGKRGGCYYINDNGNKSYVDHSYCY